MRPIDKNLFTSNLTIYNPYGEAKDDLILALGAYCSYCERQGYSSALDVEHINDKDTHPQEKFLWNNFLLACKNCNPIKSTKSVDNCLMPHIDNTFVVFSYLESGFVILNLNTDTSIKESAQNLLELVGLDRTPAHPQYSPKDKRWQERKKVWTLAQRYLLKYQKNKYDIEIIQDLLIANGFWSIWMDIFKDYTEVQALLINTINGTRKKYQKKASV